MSDHASKLTIRPRWEVEVDAQVLAFLEAVVKYREGGS